MRQYKVVSKIIKPKADFDHCEAVVYDVTIREQEEAPSDTGLVDIHGLPFYSFPEERRIGFIHF